MKKSILIPTLLLIVTSCQKVQNIVQARSPKPITPVSTVIPVKYDTIADNTSFHSVLLKTAS